MHFYIACWHSRCWGRKGVVAINCWYYKLDNVLDSRQWQSQELRRRVLKIIVHNIKFNNNHKLKLNNYHVTSNLIVLENTLLNVAVEIGRINANFNSKYTWGMLKCFFFFNHPCRGLTKSIQVRGSLIIMHVVGVSVQLKPRVSIPNSSNHLDIVEPTWVFCPGQSWRRS